MNINTALICTKPCQYVVRKESGPDQLIEYGVCYREVCTFAHSLEELNAPVCAFGERCYKQIRCTFWHPEAESRDDFYKRTNKPLPDLPATSEKTRQPRPAKKKAPVEAEKKFSESDFPRLGLEKNGENKASWPLKGSEAPESSEAPVDAKDLSSDFPVLDNKIVTIKVPRSLVGFATKFMSQAQDKVNFQIIIEE